MSAGVRYENRSGGSRGQTGNGIDLRRRFDGAGRVGGGGGGACRVHRMRVRDRRQVHHASVRPVISRPVSQVRDVRVEAGPVVFRVERKAVLPAGLRQVSLRAETCAGCVG